MTSLVTYDMPDTPDLETGDEGGEGAREMEDLLTQDSISFMSETRRRSNSLWDHELNSRTPTKLSWRQIAIVNLHWRCLTLTLMISICISLLIWCKIPGYISGEYREPCRNGLVWIPSTVTLLFYALYLVECLHCTIHRDLINIVTPDTAGRLLHRWIKAKPIIRWRAICYHYGRNIRQRYAGNGSNNTIPQLQFMRINSHSTEGRYLPYDCGCMDKSTPLKNIDGHSIIKVDIEKYFSFGCSCSEAAYLTQRKAFYESHVTVDDFIEVQETFHLAGSQIPDTLCIMKSSDNSTLPPWYCRKYVFWLFSLLCLSWPIRMIIERKTAYATFTIHKQFGARCNGILATSGNSMSSYDSKVSDNVYGVIPSYSEALLMSSYTLNVYSNTGNLNSWRSHSNTSRPSSHRQQTKSTESINSSSTGSGGTATSGSMSSSGSSTSSSALSRNPGVYSSRSRYDSSPSASSAASGRKSPVISTYQQRKPSRRTSDSVDNTSGSMHPAARALNKRASSVERIFPMRSAHPQTSKRDPSPAKDSESRTSYNRSISDSHQQRYGSGQDIRRLSSSVDYSSRLLNMSGSSERLDDSANGSSIYSDRHSDRHSTSSHHNKAKNRHSIAGDINHNTNMSAGSNMSGSNSNLYQNGNMSSRVYSSDEVEKIRAHYNQEIQDIKLDYQSRLLAKDREWDKKLQACRSELSNSQKMVMDLRQKCNDMAQEFDKSMTEMLNDKEQTNQTGMDPATNEHVRSLRNERDQYADDLTQVEKSFTELHRRYDKLRETTKSHKRNEEKMNEESNDIRRQLRDSHLNFEKLREESQEKLSKAAAEVEQAKSSCKTELLRLQMALKKSEVRAQSVEQQLHQKTEENQELAQICDNLIALKGGNTED